MERNENKARKSLIIVLLVIYIIVIFISTYFIIAINKEYKNNKLEKDNLSKTLEEKTSYLEEKNSYQKELKEKLDNLNNISENTNKLKEEVFSLASKLEKQIKDGKNTYKIAYLTFDDGPYYLTNQFLDVLDKYNVKGTFFTIGLNKDICFDNTSQSCSGMYKKIVDRGHTIANHTYSHAIFRGLYSSADSFIYQVTLQENKIKDKTGVKTNIVRFPGGSATSGSLKNRIIAKLRSKGYGWVDWTAQDGDGGALANKAEAWKNFTNSINEDIEVVLFHDYNNITLSILPQAIEYLEKNNYIILPLFYDSVMVNK